MNSTAKPRCAVCGGTELAVQHWPARGICDPEYCTCHVFQPIAAYNSLPVEEVGPSDTEMLDWLESRARVSHDACCDQMMVGLALGLSLGPKPRPVTTTSFPKNPLREAIRRAMKE